MCAVVTHAVSFLGVVVTALSMAVALTLWRGEGGGAGHGWMDGWSWRRSRDNGREKGGVGRAGLLTLALIGLLCLRVAGLPRAVIEECQTHLTVLSHCIVNAAADRVHLEEGRGRVTSGGGVIMQKTH